MFVITVGVQKGGAGKTTIALNLAEALRLSGQRVAIVDTDESRSALKWRGWAQAREHSAAPVYWADAKSLRSCVAGLEGAADVVVIDTPPQITSQSKVAMLLANVIVVPVVPGSLDVAGLEETRDALDEVRALHPRGGARTLAVLNRVKPQLRITKGAPDAVAAWGFELAKTWLGDRKDFSEAVGFGQSVLEYAPGSASCGEVRRLLGEVMA